jgi:hypothetical protein
MPNMTGDKTSILWIAVILILTSGCDERAARIAREAADRQAQQNTAMAELNQEVASGTRHLVEADARARQQIVAVHRDLQAERSRLDVSWSALEEERRVIARQRRSESLLVPLLEAAGGALLVLVLLAFCWRALAGAQRDEPSDRELAELLVQELAHEPGEGRYPERLPNNPPAASHQLPSTS